LDLPLQDFGIGPDETYQVHERMKDQRQLWRGPTAQVRLTPEMPCAIWSVLRFTRRENSFDYYE
jgi:starch synthase (maltosyl-transferring)